MEFIDSPEDWSLAARLHVCSSCLPASLVHGVTDTVSGVIRSRLMVLPK